MCPNQITDKLQLVTPHTKKTNNTGYSFQAFNFVAMEEEDVSLHLGPLIGEWK